MLFKLPFPSNTEKLLSFFTKPRSRDKDSKRKEFILIVLLLGSIALAFIFFLSAVVTKIYRIQNGHIYEGIPPEVMFILLLIFVVLYAIFRIINVTLFFYMFVSLYFILPFYTSLKWGIETPQALLSYALGIVISGILISSRFAFIASMLIFISTVFLADLQLEGKIAMDTTWRKELPDLADAICYGATLMIITIVSWLSNREMNNALRRARNSEIALRRQRDHLEITVEKRTKEIKKIEAQQLAQMHRFAEFGKIASGLFHDLATPLNLASLNLHKIYEENHAKKIYQQNREALDRALIGIQRLEYFIDSARKQIQNQTVLTNYSLNKEIHDAIEILHHRIQDSQVSVIFTNTPDITTYGNPIKFIQIVTNLISNAIESYEGLTIEKKLIEISLSAKKRKAMLTVTDFGAGIGKKDLKKIFDPFFSTKEPRKGTGIGLAICKDIVEKEMKGNITVRSQEHKGTTFRITFPIQKPPKN